MVMATVYRYKVYNITTDESTVRPLRGTREAIEMAKGEILEGTAEEVDSTLLDGNGFLRDALVEH